MKCMRVIGAVLAFSWALMMVSWGFNGTSWFISVFS